VSALGVAIAIALAAPAGAAADGSPAGPIQGEPGVAALDGGARYVAIGAGGRTVIEQIGGQGEIQRWRWLAGAYGVAAVAFDGSTTGLSADARTLVLQAIAHRYAPRRTRLAVLDARQLRIRARLVLRGWFTLDAVSPTGRWLYLIHYESRRDTLRYEVRAYDLRARRLLARPVVDPREPDEAMRGAPVTRATSADGRWAYTLYQPAEGDPFVHALDTATRRAFCVELPTLSGADATALSLRLRGDGGVLSVDSTAGPQAAIDTRTLAVSRPAPGTAARPARAGPEARGGWATPAFGVLPLVGLAAIALIARRRRRTAAGGRS
jgi:hypothetical protein